MGMYCYDDLCLSSPLLSSEVNKVGSMPRKTLFYIDVHISRYFVSAGSVKAILFELSFI
jgi:hypothetical protein